MSYHSEHNRLQPVLEQARKLDIATNPAPEAIFEAGTTGFQIWCIPTDQPLGWEDVQMDAGAFSKPCEFVAGVYWGWEDKTETVTHLVLETDAYAFQDLGIKPSHNRPDDIAWATSKIKLLFAQAGVACPPIKQEATP
jgi:hypothetical protein